MNNPTIIHKIALAVFKDKKLLMVRSAKHPEKFFNLGGKPEQGETELECLAREVAEEVQSTIKEGTLHFLRSFEAPAHGKENTIVKFQLYTGQLTSEPVPATEIEEVRYFDSSIDEKHLTPLSSEVFAWLRMQQLID